ncbi:MAG: N-acetylmuramoyl-L-alanine amidase [Pseudooceanicola sp.]|nr:N-acetylmuramoyl-L-alanine amidase [Pseudooceanicola sp.]
MIRLALILMLLAGGALAQGFGVAARVDAAGSRIADEGKGVAMTLALSQGVPWRVFTLDAPPRLVLDAQEVDWTGLDPAALLQTSRITSVRFGAYVPGWSRLVAELAAPLVIDRASLATQEDGATLDVFLIPAKAEEFAAASGAPSDPRWDLPPPVPVQKRDERRPDAPVVVVIDPGHGGIDPGAEAPGTDEKSLMLTFARELREALLRGGGFEVVLTRDDDVFVSLERRIAIAHEAGADVFISLHADSLSEGLAHGATVHVLSAEASDVASEKLAERHDRDDLLSGVDLTEADDEVTGVLLSLARQETQPRTEALAHALVQGMAQTGGPMNRRPLRAAGFSVLKAADIPSVLIEIGFLTSPRDLRNLRDARWRAGMARGIRNGLANWAASDAAKRPLVRR